MGMQKMIDKIMTLLKNPPESYANESGSETSHPSDSETSQDPISARKIARSARDVAFLAASAALIFDGDKIRELGTDINKRRRLTLNTIDLYPVMLYPNMLGWPSVAKRWIHITIHHSSHIGPTNFIT
jgi:hypothetical protein